MRKDRDLTWYRQNREAEQAYPCISDMEEDRQETDWQNEECRQDEDTEDWDRREDRKREQHVLEMIEAGLAQKKREERILSLYSRYSADGNEIILGELLQQIQAMTRSSVTKTLKAHNFYKGNEESREVSGEITLSLMVLLREDFAKGVCRENILNMIRAYYKNRTLDAIRVKYRRNGYVYRTLRPEEGDDPNPDQRRWMAGKHVISEESWEKWNTGPDGEHMERVGQSDRIHDGDAGLQEEKQALSAKLQRLYLEALLSYGKEPYKAVALCYCRVLFQVERMLDPAEIQRAGDRLAAQDDRKRIGSYEKRAEAYRAVQNTATATAPKWALERMGNRTLLELVQDSQASLRRNLSADLRWSERFLEKLEEDSGIGGKKWKDVVLTEAFTYKQINKLAESIHIAVFHAAQRRMMLECPDLVDEAVRLGFGFFTEGKAVKKGETK